MKNYTEEDLKYAYEQGKLYSNICYRREFYNVLAIINIKNISDKEYKKLMKVINK
jgi:hypothetical protein